MIKCRKCSKKWEEDNNNDIKMVVCEKCLTT